MATNSNLSFLRCAFVWLAFVAAGFAVSAQAQPNPASSPKATVAPAKSDDDLLAESPKPAGSPGAAKSDEDLLTEPAKSEDEILDPMALPNLVPNGPIETPPAGLSPFKKQLPTPVEPQ